MCLKVSFDDFPLWKMIPCDLSSKALVTAGRSLLRHESKVTKHAEYKNITSPTGESTRNTTVVTLVMIKQVMLNCWSDNHKIGRGRFGREYSDKH